MNDINPQNTFRHSVYTSTTGGGTGSKPMFFATDVHENRRARADFARLARRMGVVSGSDWAVTTHMGGELYRLVKSAMDGTNSSYNSCCRSLDLVLEILENAGASALAAGQYMAPAGVVKLIIDYHANILCGDSAQIVSIVHYISTLSQEKRGDIKLNKIIYTSEGLTPSQRALIRKVLGDISVFSILGSAEAGPYAVSCPHLSGSHWESVSYQDFIFDTRMTRIEILPSSFSEQDAKSNPEPVEDGRQGVIAQTSLTRLRNPLVRYITGDIGSLHPIPDESKALMPETDWDHLRILRLHGRDRRFSFEWDGEYLEFSQLNALLNDVQSAVVQWQVVLSRIEQTAEKLVEVRLLRSNSSSNSISQEGLTQRIETFFHVYSGNRHQFKLVYLEDDSTFQRSETARKVLKFVDNFN